MKRKVRSFDPSYCTGDKALVLVSIHQVVPVEGGRQSRISTILCCVPVEGGRHVEEGLELGPHSPGEQVLLLVQRLH